ncbi:hypothetical protein CD58_12090 [Pseudomonas brassicacearum]|uniref:hypothetical protein n=1 Tax=Pseudomonas brassicacearum TaxID=930166 RepID=UPI00042F637E|nr:hypothetical protein [Pseudomonas brassicacearum]AHL36864.1 hypothetical protein CD58_12090 [Pseudomonas brassicacearum]
MDTADNTPLDYDALVIPDGGPAHPPAPVDSVGINIAAAKLVFPHQGLRLLLPPWGDRMGRGDSYRIKLGLVPVLTGSIDEESQVGQWVERFIPVGGLVDGDFDLSYDVKILGDPDFRPSVVTKIHVKIDFAPPGGPDRDSDTPGHSALILKIPAEFLPPGAVDQEAAKQGVPVTIEPYPIMAEGDRIKLFWGREHVWGTVEKEHLPPQNTPLVITVDETTIVEDTDANGLAVVFEVYDVVDNKSDDFSAEVRVIVDTGNSRLTAPLVKEVFKLELDVDQLGEADLTFQVIAVDANFEVGDEVEMHLTGITAEGEKIEEVIFAPEKIIDVPSIPEFKRPSAAVRQLAGGLHAAFFYRLIKADGSDDLISKIFSPRIVGRANPLAAPIPLDEIAGTLDPQLPSTTIEIPLDPAMEEGNAIALIWDGITESGSPYEPDLPLHPLSQNEAEGRVPIEIVVTGEHLTVIEGGTLDLYYKLLRDVVSREVIAEESLHADLLSIGIPLAELPLPVVEGENDGVLDPADKPNGTRLIVRQYSGQKAGDRVHSLWWGSKTGRYRDSIRVTEFTENQDLPFPITAALIEGNRDGTVRAMYWVKRVAGGTSASEILHISIGVQAMPTLDNVKDDKGAEIPECTETVTATVSVNGTASKGRDVEIYDGSGPTAELKGTATADAVTGIWSLADIAVAEGGHRFYAKALYNTGGSPYSNVRLFTVGSVLNPDAPSVKEAIGDQINLIDVPNGATVQIPIEAALKDGDSGMVRWVGLAGVGSIEVPFNVVAGDEGKIKEVTVPRSVVEANVDRSITLDYLLQRRGSESAVPSESAVYDVRQQAGSGQLLVMGARANSFGYWTRRRGPIYLVALDATTRQPLEALWQYEGEVEEVRASRFRDTQPWRLLRVHTTNDQLRLNPANVFANGDASLLGQQAAAFAARRDCGNLVGWGIAGYGGSIPEPIAALNDILEVTGGLAVFVARRANGQVVAWGDRNHGGVVPEPISELRDIVEVTSSQWAFVARRATGQVIAWGDRAYGGSVPEPIANLSDIVEVTGALRAFAARRITGQVVAWGYPGGPESNPPGAITDLVDIVDVAGASAAFAVRRANGQVAAWGAMAAMSRRQSPCWRTSSRWWVPIWLLQRAVPMVAWWAGAV